MPFFVESLQVLPFGARVRPDLAELPEIRNQIGCPACLPNDLALTKKSPLLPQESCLDSLGTENQSQKYITCF